MLHQCGFSVLDLSPGNIDGVSYLIQTMFPSPFAIVGKALSIYSKTLVLCRRLLFPPLIKILYKKNRKELDKKLAFLEKDSFRYAAAIIFLATKNDS